MRTSEDNCFSVWVRFLLASASAFVSNFGFFAGGSDVLSFLVGLQTVSGGLEVDGLSEVGKWGGEDWTLDLGGAAWKLEVCVVEWAF